MFHTSAIKLKTTLGNNNAQHIDSHVDLPSKVKVQQTKFSLEDPAGLAAWVGMVHYISTVAIAGLYSCTVSRRNSCASIAG